jgi:deazaflavin-dependent oxidoreductase (nitroreductase family)
MSGGVRRAARLINPLVAKLAGTRLMPFYGLLEHRGRRSGKTFRTPVVARRTADGFVVPMPWGEGTDWYRNVRAAGDCVIRWNGRTYHVGQPEVVDSASGAARFGGAERTIMQRAGIRQVLVLHDLVTASAASAA